MSEFAPAFIGPAFRATGPVRSFTTTRRGGVGLGTRATLALGGSGRAAEGDVAANRARLRRLLDLPGEPVWLRQVHGTRCVELEGGEAPGEIEADAAWTAEPGVVCAVLTADCLPVIVADRGGRAVGVAHAGWRGLAGGVLEALVRAMPAGAGRLEAWLGPAIGPGAFEVGPEVREAFVSADPDAADAFAPGAGDRCHADLYRLARRRLRNLGVARIGGGGHCTWHERDRFFSHRRDGAGAGRMATLAWLEPTA